MPPKRSAKGARPKEVRRKRKAMSDISSEVNNTDKRPRRANTQAKGSIITPIEKKIKTPVELANKTVAELLQQTKQQKLVQKRTAAVMVYTDMMEYDQAGKLCSLAPATIRKYTQTLPRNLLEDRQHMQVTRAANVLFKLAERRAYTNWEMKQALWVTEMGSMGTKEAMDKFGPHQRTLNLHRQALRKISSKSLFKLLFLTCCSVAELRRRVVPWWLS